MSTACYPCRAWIERPGYAAFCERDAFLNGIGCLKRNAPPTATPEHTGKPPLRAATKKRGRRKA